MPGFIRETIGFLRNLLSPDFRGVFSPSEMYASACTQSMAEKAPERRWNEVAQEIRQHPAPGKVSSGKTLGKSHTKQFADQIASGM